MPRRSHHHFSLNFELPAEPPAEVELIPAGDRLVGRDGRNWQWDQVSQQAVLDEFVARGLPLPVDVNHAQELRAPKGEDSPAYAWIESLRVRDGALFGQVTWNPRGQDAVRNREYRFLSPVFDYRPEDGRIVRLTSVALTNEPNLRLPALNHQETQMKRELTTAIAAALALALGTTADSTDEEIVAALNQFKRDFDTARASNAAQPSLDRYVPRADYDALATRATNAEQALRERDQAAHQSQVDGEIDAALKAGKITPATVDYHRASCADKAGLERFRAFVAAAPVIAQDSTGIEGKPSAGGSATALNAIEREVCERLGLGEEQFLKVRNQRAA